MAGHNLESVIKDTGSCGRFQVRQMMAINSIRFICNWGFIFMSFGNYNPGWRCKIAINRTSLESSLNLTTGSAAPNLGLDVNPGPQTEPLIIGHTGRMAFDGHDIKTGDRSANGNSSRGCISKQSNSSNLNSSRTNSDLISVKCVLGSPEPESFSNRYSMDCEGFQSCPDVEFDPVVQTIVTEWGLACHRNWIVPTIISIQMVGIFVGSVSSGQISEQFGRRISYYGHCGICSVSSFIAAFSVSWQMYAVCSFFVGLGTGGVLAVAMVYSFEFLNPRWRAILGGFPLLNLSATLFAFVVYLSPNWRHLHLILAIASGLCLCSVFWTPESMRWLAVHGKIEKAKAVVKKIATINRVPEPEDNVLEELFSTAASAPGNGSSHVDGNSETTNNKGSNEQEASSMITPKTVRPSYLDLFREKRLRSLIIRLSLAWVCLMTTYFTLSFSVKSFQGNFFINLFVYSVVEIPFVILVGPLANRVGRRWAGLGFLLLASLLCIAVILITVTAPSDDENIKSQRKESDSLHAHALASLVLAALAKALVAGGRNTIGIITIELPPTSVRNLSFAFCVLTAQLGVIVAPFLIPKQGTFHISFSIMAVLTLVAGAILFSLPETKGRPMVDTSMRESSTRENDKRDTGRDLINPKTTITL